MAYSDAIFQNTYLFLMPHELQDYIQTIVNYKENFEDCMCELKVELSPDGSFNSCNKTFFEKKVDVIITNYQDIDSHSLASSIRKWIYINNHCLLYTSPSPRD